MNRSNHITTLVDEEIWRAWILKGKQRDQAAARKAKIFAAIVLTVIALAFGFYHFLPHELPFAGAII